eukprot:9496040-Pyramimonas_sp.AAC.1
MAPGIQPGGSAASSSQRGAAMLIATACKAQASAWSATTQCLRRGAGVTSPTSAAHMENH